MKISILTECGSKIGYGHLTRCTSLYQAFEERGYTPKFYINGDCSLANYNWIENHEFLDESDIIILDSYLADEDFINYISSKVPLMVFIDDNKRLNYPKGIVVNGTIFAEKLNYPTNTSLDYLLGSEYIPLRKEFWQEKRAEVKEKIETVLITLGGNDLRNLTPKILKILNQNFPNLNKKVIIANNFSNKEEIENLVNEKTEVIYNPDASGMLDSMLVSDIAVSGCGQTLHELASVGLPTIAIGIIDNQINNIKNWQEQEFIKYIGCWNNPDLEKNLIEGIKSINREKSHIRGIEAVDGQGSRRITKKILNKYIKDNSLFRESNATDCLKIFEIASDENVRKNSFNPDKIKLENHKKWFKNILNSDLYELFVLEFENDIVGQVRFDFNDKYPVISISLNKKYRNLSLSKFLLSTAIDSVDENTFLAYIKVENEHSIGLFKGVGFEFIEKCSINGYESLKFIYNKN